MFYAALILALIPGLAWLFFYLEEDDHPKSKLLIALTFLGGAVAAIIALTVQLLSYRTGLALDPAQGHELTLYFFWSLTFLAFTEELVKFLAAYFVVHKNAKFSAPIEAMVYMAIAALGFATLENLGVVFPDKGGQIVLGLVFETLLLRFVGATLLHTLPSSIVGYYWALDLRHFMQTRFLILGLALATALHAVFNYLIIIYNDFGYSLVFVVAIGLLVLSDFEKLRRRPL